MLSGLYIPTGIRVFYFSETEALAGPHLLSQLWKLETSKFKLHILSPYILFSAI